MTHPADPLFTPDGAIAKRLGDEFELRPQQLAMDAAVAQSLESRSTLFVEAGTGVGKSFAYLVPAIRRIINSGGSERVVIATNTIALQEQLAEKDLPFLLDVMGQDPSSPDTVVRAELVKGRGNYVSLRRLAQASKRQERLLPDAPSRRSLHVIEDWAYTTTDGSLATLPPIERPGIWDRVQSDSGNCMGRKCPLHNKCFYQSARQRMERANLIVTNHALFFSDLALRSRDVGFLPAYHHVVLDEAHQIEDVASDHFGLSLAEGRVRHLLSALFQGRAKKGFLATIRAGASEMEQVARIVSGVQTCHAAADHFFASLVDCAQGVVGSRRLRTPGAVENTLSDPFRQLALALRRLKQAELPDEDRFELNAYAQRAAAIADEAKALIEQELDGCAYWIEVSARDSVGIRSTLACSPVDVAPILQEHLFCAERSVILTSATLTTANESFDHITQRLGAPDARTLALGSPFDHAEQISLHLDQNMPDPKSAPYLARLCDQIAEHIRATDGGAFVLFTSFQMLRDASDRLRPALETDGHTVVVQGQGGSRSEILARFKSDSRSVLFGTNSFWQGIDVPGHTLRNVIITRLPFEPPDRPLTQARLEMIAERGGNPFREDTLPRAIIRFKQGFGRLVRTATDRGRVVVLDRRILTKSYGRAFLSALPNGIRTLVDGEVVATEPIDA